METVILYKNVIEVFKLQQVKNYSEYPRQEKKIIDSDDIFNVSNVGDDNKVTYNLSGNIKKQERYEFEYLDKESREVSEDVFLSHLNNPLSHLSVRRVTLVLVKCGDKLKLSIYRFYKERKVGAKYFWKKSSNLYYVFNKKSGNFFTIKSEKSGRKKNNTINQNNFDSLINTPDLPFQTSFYNSKSTHIRSFGLENKYTVSGDTNVAIIATFRANPPVPQLEYTIVMIRGLEHNYPNGVNHPVKGAELNWQWLKQFSQ
jgi:hypothetical protein